MKKESLAVIGIRLIAIYLIARGILYLPSLPQLWMGPSAETSMLVSYSIAILFPLIVGIVLYAISSRVTKLICNGLGVDETNGEDIKTKDLHGIALSIAGMMIIAMRLPDLINTIMRIKRTAEVNDSQAEYFSDALFLSELMVMLLGVSLFLGSKFWVNLYRWFQNFGLNNK